MDNQPNIEDETLIENEQKATAKRERKANKKRLDLALIMTVSVALMSLCALVVSFYQAHLMNEQSSIIFSQGKAAALPILEFGIWRSFDDDGIKNYRIVVENKGTGPLIVESVLLKYKGEPILNWNELFSKYPDSDKLDLWMTNGILSGSVLSSGEKLVFIDSKNNTDLAKILYKLTEDVKIKVCYTSVYGDWFQDTIKGLENRVTNENESIPFCRNNKGNDFLD